MSVGVSTAKMMTESQQCLQGQSNSVISTIQYAKAATASVTTASRATASAMLKDSSATPSSASAHHATTMRALPLLQVARHQNP